MLRLLGCGFCHVHWWEGRERGLITVRWSTMLVSSRWYWIDRIDVEAVPAYDEDEMGLGVHFVAICCIEPLSSRWQRR